MSFKEHEFKRGAPPRSSDVWSVSVNAASVRFGVPRTHPISRASHVRVFLGEAEDAGWLLLLPSAPALGARKLSKTRFGSIFLQFKRRFFPGLPSSFACRATILEMRPDPEGRDGIVLRLPWFSKEAPRSSPPSTGLTDLLTQVSTGPTDALVAPLKVVRSVTESLPRPSAPKSPRSDDAAKVEAFLAERAACVMSLEQVAEYVRGMGRRCVIREDGATRGPIGTWARRTTVILDGEETTPEKLFAVMNAYRQARSLPPIAPPVAA